MTEASPHSLNSTSKMPNLGVTFAVIARPDARNYYVEDLKQAWQGNKVNEHQMHHEMIDPL